MTFVVLTAGIDLSVGSLLALTGIILSKLFNDVGLPAPLAVLAAIAIAALIGAGVNGVLIGRVGPVVLRRDARHALDLRRHREPLVAHADAVRHVVVHRQHRVRRDRSASRRRSGSWSATYLIAFVVLRWTYFGRDVYAVGGNIEAARLSGINVARTLMIVYGIAGLGAGIAGVIQVGRLGAASPMVGADIPLNSAAAVLLGGTSFLGGVGGVSGTAVGVLFIGTLQNGLAIAGVQSFWQQVVTGVILIVAIAIDRVQQGEQPLAAQGRWPPRRRMGSRPPVRAQPMPDELEVLWQPLRLRGATLPNRIMCTATTVQYGVAGMVNDRHLYFYRERARGGVGLLFTEQLTATPLSDTGFPTSISAHDERQVERLAQGARGDSSRTRRASSGSSSPAARQR